MFYIGAYCTFRNDEPILFIRTTFYLFIPTILDAFDNSLILFKIFIILCTIFSSTLINKLITTHNKFIKEYRRNISISL